MQPHVSQTLVLPPQAVMGHKGQGGETPLLAADGRAAGWPAAGVRDERAQGAGENLWSSGSQHRGVVFLLVKIIDMVCVVFLLVAKLKENKYSMARTFLFFFFFKVLHLIPL